MSDELAEAVARVRRTAVTGEFRRHTAVRVTTLHGTSAGGRWGPPGAFPVLYLGRPPASVIVEAYRHLVDSVEGMRPELVAPRRIFTCEVAVTEVVDLRTAEAQDLVGLDEASLRSEVGDNARCQAVASTAHELGAHGIVAPAATGLGETLALFTTHLPTSELPLITSVAIWERLPPDPRRLRSVNEESG